MDVLTSKDQVSEHSVRSAMERMIHVAELKNQDWHKLIDEYEAEFFQEVTGDDSESDQKVYLPDLGNAAQIGKNILINAGFKIDIDRPGEMHPDKVKAEAIEEYLHKMVHSVKLRTGVDIYMRLTDYTMRLSAGVLHWSYNENPIAGLEDYESPLNHPPVDIFVVDPRNFLPIPGGPFGQFHYVIHKEQRTLADAIQIVYSTLGNDEWAIKNLRRYYGHIKGADVFQVKENLYNYWGWHNVGGRWVIVNAIMFGGAVLRPFTVMPGYKVFPWAIAPAIDTGAADHHRRYLPFTFHARKQVRSTERRLGRMDVILDKIASLPFVLEVSPESPTPPRMLGDNKYVVTLKPGQRWESPQYASIPRDMWPMLEHNSHQIEKSLLPEGIYGMGRGQADSGYGIEQQAEGGRLRLNEPRKNLSFAITQMFKGCLSLIAEHKPHDVIYATYRYDQRGGARERRVILRGVDLKGWNINVNWSDELPGDEMRRTAQAAQMKGSDLMSDETILRKYLRVEDPVGEIERRVSERVAYNHPQLLQARAFEMLKDRGMLPRFTPEQQVKIGMFLERKLGELLALGVPPQLAMQRIQSIRQGIIMALLGRNPTAMGVLPMGGQQILQPGVQPEQTPEQQVRGGAPPGNPADPGATLRDLANRTNGTRGRRE